MYSSTANLTETKRHYSDEAFLRRTARYSIILFSKCRRVHAYRLRSNNRIPDIEYPSATLTRSTMLLSADRPEDLETSLKNAAAET